MRKFFYIIYGFFLVLSLQGIAQVCGFDHKHNQLLKNEAFARQMIQNEEQIQQLIKSGNFNPRLNSDPPYTIPVVIHVVHTGGAIGTNYNPSDNDIIKMVEYTNLVFAGTAPGLSGGVGDMQVQFVLAKRDPNCNPTNGIVRVNGSGVDGYSNFGVMLDQIDGATELSIKNLSRWNTSQYYNIWIINKIDGSDGYSSGGVAGFAYFPGASSNLDGTMMLAAYAEDGNKILPHELGHAFNLYHPFQGSSSSGQCPSNDNCSSQGDRVCDTDPISNNVTGGVTSFVCRTGTNPCTGAPYSPNTENNIMSYTNCFTLFTAGQKERVLASMSLASRLSLTTSLGATAPNLAPVCPPKINFVSGPVSAPEAPGSVIDCRKYTDYTYQMTIGSAPSQNATVTLSVNGGNATSGYDYILTTSDDFTSPSNTINFPSGNFANRSFKIRVFDDAYIEGNETLELGFSVNANGGNSQKGDGITTMVITIMDNDAEPKQQVEKVDVVGTLQYTLGTAATGSNPLNSKLAQKKNVWVIRANELTAKGFTAGTITSIALNIQKNSTRPYQNFQVKMGATALNYLVDGGVSAVATSTVTSINNFNTINGWNIIALNAPFAWNGTSNIAIELCYQNDVADESQSSDVTIGFADGGSGTQGSFYFQSDKNCTTPFEGSIGLYYNGIKPTTGFVMNIPQNQTETILNASTNGYLGPFGEMYFYTTTGNILAKIKNLTNWDYGCTEVKIDRAGTGTKAFINNNAANAITDKTISVIPTNNNPAGQYEITLFYRPNEVAGYKTATGSLWQEAAIVKTTNAISSYIPGSVVSGETAMGGNILKGFYGMDSTIKATFSGSFSGFGVIPSATLLPVSWLTFNGKMVRGNAELDWSTASEQNNSHFDVEISRDANGFSKIGIVKGAGTSSQVSNYGYSHIKPLAGINYYRIRQVDKDGQSSLSQVIGLRSETLGEPPFLYPNPARSTVMLDWGEMAGQPGRWELLTPDMKALKSGQSAFTSSVQVISIGELPAGVYYLKLSSGKQEKVLRFIKQ